MPTYPYACTECGHEFEKFQSFSEDALTDCPECGGRLKKVWGSVGVVFKGSGFYRNDSRSSNAKSDSGSTSSSSKSDSSSSTSDSKSDSKSTAKSDSKSTTTKAS